MVPAIKIRLLPYLSILVFIVFTIPHLSYQFYCDESWVYARAIAKMYAHGVSLSPIAIPTDLSRGHPMLYPAACAVWMDIFGTSHFVQHCFALFISFMLAVGCYEILLSLFGRKVALLALTLLLTNVSFFACSGFLLTDIPLGLFALLAIWSYTKKKYLLTAVFLVVIGYLKETGLVIFAVFGADIVIKFISKQEGRKVLFYRLFSVVLPVFAIVAFFVIQKNELGWYFYPYHIHFISFSVAHSFQNAQKLLNFLFFYYNYVFYYALFGLIAIAAAINTKKYSFTLLVITEILTYLCLQKFAYNDAIFFAFIGVLILSVLWFLCHKFRSFNTDTALFLKLVAAFSLTFCYFSCINFFSTRYLFPITFLVSIVFFAVFSVYFINKIASQIFPYYLVIVAIFGLYNIWNKNAELDAFSRMTMQQNSVDFFEQNHLYNAFVYGNYMRELHLSDASSGFRRTPDRFTHLDPYPTDSTQYFIFDDIDGDPDYWLFTKIKTDPHYKLIRRWVGDKPNDFLEIYQKYK